LASFFGVAFAVNAVVTLILRIFVSSRYLGRFGLPGGLLLMPLTIAIGGMFALAGGLGSSLTAVFWSVVAMRLGYFALYDSIGRPAELVLYQPLTPRRRLLAQSVAETNLLPAVTGLSGILLLLFVKVAPLNGASLSAPLIVVAALWACLALAVSRRYSQALLGALGKRSLRSLSQLTLDATTIGLLEQHLADPRPSTVIYCLNRLEQAHYDGLGANLVQLLGHPHPDVRLDALQRLERLRTPDALGLIHELGKGDASPAVRAAAIRAEFALAGQDIVADGSGMLHDDDPHVRQAAAVGMLRYGGIEGVMTAAESFFALLGSSDEAERGMAAEILAAVGNQSFCQPLVKLLHDDSPNVVAQALTAAGAVPHPRLWTEVVPHLAAPGLRLLAFRALVAGGDAAMSEVARSFDDPEVPPESKRRLARVAGRGGGPEALVFLRTRIAYPHRVIRHEILRGLSINSYQAVGAEIALAQTTLGEEAGNASWLLAAAADFAAADELSLLAGAVSTESRRSRENLLLLLSFIYPSRAVMQAKVNLATGASPERRAYALEVLDGLLAPDTKRLVLPLLEAQPVAGTLHNSGGPPQSSDSQRQWLREVVTRDGAWISDWTRACAAHAIGRVGAGELAYEVTALLTHGDDIVRQASAEALGKLDERAAHAVHH